MPLDGHTYLVSQGWTGKGTGLRPGAISRAIAVPKKRNLAGVGKDRDEAFPFWDHLFAAASTSIKIKCGSSDEESDSDAATSSKANEIKRTATGIPSTRRPVQTPSSSGDTTPASDGINSSMSRLSLMAQAKRAAAKKGLYARFYRGEVLATDMKDVSSSSQSIAPTLGSPSEASEARDEEQAFLHDDKMARKIEKEKRREERRRAKEARRIEKRRRKTQKQATEMEDSQDVTAATETISQAPQSSTSIIAASREEPLRTEEEVADPILRDREARKSERRRRKGDTAGPRILEPVEQAEVTKKEAGEDKSKKRKRKSSRDDDIGPAAENVQNSVDSENHDEQTYILKPPSKSKEKSCKKKKNATDISIPRSDKNFVHPETGIPAKKKRKKERNIIQKTPDM